MRVVVINHISLDGVIQGPALPEEDTRDGFRHGGWSRAGNDPAMGEAMAGFMAGGFAWLLGRRSYEELLAAWNERGGPFQDSLNDRQKYVASSHADLELRWPRSTLLTGDVPAEVARLRERDGGNLVVMGSGGLVRSLLARGQVDDLLLMTHPVVLGSGRRLFGPEEQSRELDLVEATTTTTGVILATYRKGR